MRLGCSSRGLPRHVAIALRDAGAAVQRRWVEGAPHPFLARGAAAAGGDIGPNRGGFNWSGNS
jgi:hypothetical protein